MQFYRCVFTQQQVVTSQAVWGLVHAFTGSNIRFISLHSRIYNIFGKELVLSPGSMSLFSYFIIYLPLQLSSLEQPWMKKALRDTNTAHGTKNFCPAADPLPGAQDGQNLISWSWSLPSPTDPIRWGLMHSISSYRGNRLTNPQTNPQIHTNKQTHRQDRLQYTAPQLACSVTNYVLHT